MRLVKQLADFFIGISQRRLALGDKTLIPRLRLKRNLGIISGVPADGKIRLLVDIAIKALSPAINDPTTAVQALNEIEDLLLRLG